MPIFHLPTLISCLAFLVLGTYVFLKNRRHPVNLFFALGMGALALMELGNFMVLVSSGFDAVLFWKRISSVGECFISGTWLAFSMSFARKEPWQVLKEWKIAFIGVGAASVFFAAFVFSGLFMMPSDSPALLSLSWIGKAFYIFFLVGTVSTVASLEHTIRQSKGEQRATIRLLIMGLGGLLVFLIFTTSQNLLFSQINLGMVPVTSSVFIICTALIAFSLVRHRLMDVNFYMSRFVMYNSLTILAVGGYLILIGLVTQVAQSLELVPGYPLEILFLFVAILILLGIFLSDRLRWKAKLLINKHFYRSRYDYRQEWLKFSEGLSLKIDIHDLIPPIVNLLRDSVGVNEVSLWLVDTTTGKLTLAQPHSKGKGNCLIGNQEFLNAVVEKKTPFSPDVPWARGFFTHNNETIKAFRVCLVVPMVARKELVGLILLGKKTTGEPFLSDDIDLLRSAGAQIAGAIVNANLSRELIHTKEMEMFHRLSSFVLHDLKNLVSSLSLIVQNASEHMGNPQFQQDSLETIRTSVKKMEALVSKLSSQDSTLMQNPQDINLNEVVSEVAGRMCQNGLSGKVELQTDLGKVPPVHADREQIQKVVENLILNASEAIDDGGSIMIKTEANKQTVILSVSDTGRGMTQHFIEKSLFKPFRSTKKKGLGIGLYQCNTIVETHGGRIEVESQEGKGSAFRVILPAMRVRGA